MGENDKDEYCDQCTPIGSDKAECDRQTDVCKWCDLSKSCIKIGKECKIKCELLNSDECIKIHNHAVGVNRTVCAKKTLQNAEIVHLFRVIIAHRIAMAAVSLTVHQVLCLELLLLLLLLSFLLSLLQYLLLCLPN